MKNYTPLKSFILRTPILPTRFFYCNDNSIDIIKDIWSSETFQEGIYISSSKIYNYILELFESETKNKEKISEILIKYYTRASTRATPYGLFASVTAGNLSEDDNIELLNSYKKDVRFDFELLNEIRRFILKDENILYNINFYPNCTILKVLNQYRYYEPYETDNEILYRLSTFEFNPLLSEILKLSKEGISINVLIEKFDNQDYPTEELKGYFDELISSKFLMSELELKVSGVFYFKYIKKTLKIADTNQDYYNLINDLDKRLTNIKHSHTFSIGDYKEIKDVLIKYEIALPRTTFQIDSYRNTSKLAIKRKSAWHVLKGVDILNRLVDYKKNKSLSLFFNNFQEKYGDRKIPLLLALDPMLGIGYSVGNDSILLPYEFTSLVNSLTKKTPSTFKQTIDSYLLISIIDAAKNRLDEVEVDEKKLPVRRLDLASTFSSLVTITNEKYNGNNKIQIHAVTGGTSATLIGRFGYLDKSIYEHLTSISIKENCNNKGKIIADISHIPSPRLGNIIARPSFREYEIPIFSVVENTIKKIELSDLYISIKSGKITIESKKHKCQVIPKLSIALNYSKVKIPIYRFLCDIQEDNEKKSKGLSLILDDWLDKLKFLPRITYKNIILSPKRWKLNVDNLANKTMTLDKIECLKAWIKEHNLPETFQYSDKVKNTEIAINIANEASCKLFLKLIKTQKEIIISEFIPLWDKVKDDRNEIYANEIIFTYSKGNEN